jgi:hypothetical protein
VTDIYVPEAAGARLLKDHLKLHMSTKYPALTYGLGLDKDWTPAKPPALVVFNDGGPLEYGAGGRLITTRPTLRVVVWSDGLTLSGNIAAYALGQTLSRKAEGFSQILPGTGLLDARDTNNGGIMVSYTVRTRLRVTLVTEP